jgi:hypothetical protein
LRPCVSQSFETHGEVTALGPVGDNVLFAAEAALMLCRLFACFFQIGKRKEQQEQVYE